MAGVKDEKIRKIEKRVKRIEKKSGERKKIAQNDFEFVLEGIILVFYTLVFLPLLLISVLVYFLAKAFNLSKYTLFFGSIVLGFINHLVLGNDIGNYVVKYFYEMILFMQNITEFPSSLVTVFMNVLRLESTWHVIISMFLVSTYMILINEVKRKKEKSRIPVRRKIKCSTFNHPNNQIIVGMNRNECVAINEQTKRVVISGKSIKTRKSLMMNFIENNLQKDKKTIILNIDKSINKADFIKTVSNYGKNIREIDIGEKDFNYNPMITSDSEALKDMILIFLKRFPDLKTAYRMYMDRIEYILESNNIKFNFETLRKYPPEKYKDMVDKDTKMSTVQKDMERSFIDTYYEISIEAHEKVFNIINLYFSGFYTEYENNMEKLLKDNELLIYSFAFRRYDEKSLYMLGFIVKELENKGITVIINGFNDSITKKYNEFVMNTKNKIITIIEELDENELGNFDIKHHDIYVIIKQNPDREIWNKISSIDYENVIRDIIKLTEKQGIIFYNKSNEYKKILIRGMKK
ncbi:MAG: hypothetical protein N4A47_04760 [Clostridia bacterium]|nr:hypothetical protein [Clostridia bacterium]